MKRRLTLLRRSGDAGEPVVRSGRSRLARVGWSLAVAGATASAAFLLAQRLKNRQAEPAEPDGFRQPTLLDQWMPVSEFRDTIKVRIQATPREIFAAFDTVTLADMPLAWLLGSARYLPAMLSGKMAYSPPDAQPFAKQLIDMGSGVLAQDPDRELVIGTIGKLHQLRDQAMVPFKSPEEFMAFSDPAYQKLAISIRVEPGVLLGEYTLVLEHRTHALSEEAQNQFARYWLAIKPGGAFMSKLLLNAVKNRAEQGASPVEAAPPVPVWRPVAAA